MLTIVRNRPAAELDRLRVAAAHLQAAVVHINNEAQRRVSASADGDRSQVEELRLIVRGLCDVIDALESAHRDDPRRIARRLWVGAGDGLRRTAAVVTVRNSAENADG